ncbi:hypothetical protein E5E91_05950 [Deinococcus radiodurans R1 = ATCC 13939 = DSM 20539]|uniref:Uncharacterized protein n=1 Tax=Deinococcus radiodurans (strain ATCC 13939 / DSM 20539 / JCM 16871 / CCUG 27074 / LMG 4051 / NBRC 15346 / NCIMB 9279 / VKM B-1422 / R1) TaxID=243230 RepID=Q9RV87_DEIRA|nr:hypothetical protein DR_1142 [Deinococcus radiodurans R1 = ATCC 13939 = DSM 20539]QEM72739.1 hypothetical protein DXG80_01865 [Deinococcus radiodurans]UDL01688.1 hypothetical protein E5E91_05950 [Deinococcus radiodurans R1 = ATCC 13939 = DSM 20539]
MSSSCGSTVRRFDLLLFARGAVPDTKRPSTKKGHPPARKVAPFGLLRSVLALALGFGLLHRQFLEGAEAAGVGLPLDGLDREVLHLAAGGADLLGQLLGADAEQVEAGLGALDALLVDAALAFDVLFLQLGPHAGLPGADAVALGFGALEGGFALGGQGGGALGDFAPLLLAFRQLGFQAIPLALLGVKPLGAGAGQFGLLGAVGLVVEAAVEVALVAVVGRVALAGGPGGEVALGRSAFAGVLLVFPLALARFPFLGGGRLLRFELGARGFGGGIVLGEQVTQRVFARRQAVEVTQRLAFGLRQLEHTLEPGGLGAELLGQLRQRARRPGLKLGEQPERDGHAARRFARLCRQFAAGFLHRAFGGGLLLDHLLLCHLLLSLAHFLVFLGELALEGAELTFELAVLLNQVVEGFEDFGLGGAVGGAFDAHASLLLVLAVVKARVARFWVCSLTRCCWACNSATCASAAATAACSESRCSS